VLTCEASVSSSNCRSGSGLARMGALVIRVIILSWASTCLGPHSNGMSFPVSAVRGAAMMLKLGQNMRWYPATPRNPRTCRLSLSTRG